MTQILYHPPFHFLLVQNFLLVENNDRRRRFCFFFSFSFLPTIPFFFRNAGISSRHCYCATPIHAGPVTSAFESTIFSLSVRTLECDGDGMGDQKNYRTMKNTPDRRRHRHVTKSIPRGMVLEKKKGGPGWADTGFMSTARRAGTSGLAHERILWAQFGGLFLLAPKGSAGVERASSSCLCSHGERKDRIGNPSAQSSCNVMQLADAPAGSGRHVGRCGEPSWSTSPTREPVLAELMLSKPR